MEKHCASRQGSTLYPDLIDLRVALWKRSIMGSNNSEVYFVLIWSPRFQALVVKAYITVIR